MATLDERILGYKKQNYVSSSESEDEGVETAGASSDNSTKQAVDDFRLLTPKTGPKGVIQDYQRYKQLETEQRREQEQELKALANKFSLSCQTSLDDQRERELMKELEIDEDEFLKQYHLKRLLQMKEEQQQRLAVQRHKFGKVVDIPDKDEFLHAIENELIHVVIVIHLYDEISPSCTCMNECLNVLAQQYPMIKFCKVVAANTGISKHFRENGLPALLVYKGTHMIGNFVQLGNILGEDFYSTDVESFLVENEIISEEIEVQPLSRKTEQSKGSQDDEDSDLD